MKNFGGIIMSLVGAALIGVGVFFHYKNKSGYDGYFWGGITLLCFGVFLTL